MKWTIPISLVMDVLICVSVNYVDEADELRQQQKDMTVGKFKISIDGKFKHVNLQFQQIHKDLGAIEGRLAK